jgi:poly-gamma-glutamate synthesis protein (capsule biosynthesis protein)
MLGRAIDQILRHASKRQLYEPHVDCAITYGRSEQAPRGPQSASQINRPPPAAWTCSDLPYVRLAEEANGPIPRHAEPAYVWGDALAVLRDRRPAACVVNLETAITTSSDPWLKGINYRMHLANVECLTAAEVDCCVLANNHVLDWRQAGLLETLHTLWSGKIRTAGAGSQAETAAAPAVLPLGEAGERSSTASAQPRVASLATGLPPLSGAGVNLLPDLSVRTAASIAELARTASKPGDLLVASVHWGSNWGYDIPSALRAFAHTLVDGGFAIVHGHSSHHPRGIEFYCGGLILYGCGDFINDYERITGYEEFRGDLAVMYLPEFDTTDYRFLSLDMVPMQMRRFLDDGLPDLGVHVRRR